MVVLDLCFVGIEIEAGGAEIEATNEPARRPGLVTTAGVTARVAWRCWPRSGAWSADSLNGVAQGPVIETADDDVDAAYGREDRLRNRVRVGRTKNLIRRIHPCA